MQIKENGISKKKFNSFCKDKKMLLEKKGEKYFLLDKERKKIKVGLTGGVFDILHIGHISTLNQAKKYCDVLIVVTARNKHILNKKRKVLHSEEYRAKMVESLKPVDAVVLGCEEYKETLKRIMPDVIIYGYDQKPFLKPDDLHREPLDSQACNILPARCKTFEKRPSLHEAQGIPTVCSHSTKQNLQDSDKAANCCHAKRFSNEIKIIKLKKYVEPKKFKSNKIIKMLGL